MDKLFAVTFVGGLVTIVMYASEDGERYQAPTKCWAQVAEPKRLVKDGQVGMLNGKIDGRFGEWFLARGVYEFWTDSPSVAHAVAMTARMAGVFAGRS